MTRRRWPALSACLSWITLVGVVAAVGGLAWDAVLHARDPLLASHESVLTASNPAHVLLAIGLALAFAGQAGVVTLRLSGIARRVAAGLLALFTVTAGAALGWSQETAAQQDAASRQLVAQTQAGVAKYRDINAAMRAGYEPMTPLNWPMVEWINPAFTKAGRVVDVNRPERLMYVTAAGGLMLAGAMFVLPQGASAPPAIASAHWHRHTDLCYLSTGAIVGTNSYGSPCPAGSVARPSPLMLHVWVVPNPQGPFADDLTPAAIALVANRE